MWKLVGLYLHTENVDNQELNEKWRWKISELSRRKYTSVLNTSLKITTCTVPAVELTLESGKLFVGKILEISTQSFDKSGSGSTAHTIDNLWRVFGLGMYQQQYESRSNTQKTSLIGYQLVSVCRMMMEIIATAEHIHALSLTILFVLKYLVPDSTKR